MFEAKFKINGHEYIVEVEWKGEKTPLWGIENDEGRHNIIRISNKKNLSYTIDYWAPGIFPNAENFDGVLDILDCIHDDLISVCSLDFTDEEKAFEDFAAEFGYNSDSRKAYKVFEALIEEFRGLSVIFGEKDLKTFTDIERDNLAEKLCIEEV